MKKIRTAQGGLLFLADEDYMPKLVQYLRETAGYDAAALVEEWAQEQVDRYAEAMANSEGARLDLSNRCANLERDLRGEQEEHLSDVEELEGELERLAGVKDGLMAANTVLTDLINHPEKLFPEVGASVWREIDGKRQIGTITAVSLKKDYRTGKTEFAIIARFGCGNGARYRLSSIGKTIHLIEGPRDGDAG